MNFAGQLLKYFKKKLAFCQKTTKKIEWFREDQRVPLLLINLPSNIILSVQVEALIRTIKGKEDINILQASLEILKTAIFVDESHTLT